MIFICYPSSVSEPPHSCFQGVLQNWVNKTCPHHHHKQKRVIHLIFLFRHLRWIHVWTEDDKRGIVNERCSKWEDRVEGVRFGRTLGTAVKTQPETQRNPELLLVYDCDCRDWNQLAICVNTLLIVLMICKCMLNTDPELIPRGNSPRKYLKFVLLQ